MGISNLTKTPFLILFVIIGAVGISSAFAGTITLSGTTIVNGTVTADDYFDFKNTQTGINATAIGGSGNIANATHSTVGGGVDNTASGDFSIVGGGFSNTASGGDSTVGGGALNIASGVSSSVGGGQDNIANATRSTVGGGVDNTASGDFSIVGGGFSNTASGGDSTVGGGALNIASGVSSSVGGGQDNIANATRSTVGGGVDNTASGDFSTISGGDSNTASGSHSTVSGGGFNFSTELFSTVSGGGNNHATGSVSTIGGGGDNLASGLRSTLGGGGSNIASGGDSTLGGGFNNTASGDWSTIPGGTDNEAAEDYSFAAGRQAKAIHDGSFVWADSTGVDYSSTTPDQFKVRATNNTVFDTTNFLVNGILRVTDTDTALAVFDRKGSDGDLVAFRHDGMTEGVISVAGGVVTYGPFTGSHYAWMDQVGQKGLLVSMNGDNKFLNGNPHSEIIYGVDITSKKNDPAILGAYLAIKENSIEQSDTVFHFVMSEGNGEVWVADTGVDISPGDYLISSEVAGHTMKDDRSEEISHIIGRAAEPILWDEVSETINGIKHKKISILFNFVPLNNGIME